MTKAEVIDVLNEKHRAQIIALIIFSLNREMIIKF